MEENSNTMSVADYNKKIKSKRPRRNLEHDAQSSVFNWALWNKNTYPELDLMFAIPNGGHRHINVAKKMKAEGVKSGVPDIFLPVPRGGYYGLWIELKVGKNKPSSHQKLWLMSLEEQGFKCNVCYGAEETIDTIKEYLELPS